MKRVTLGMFLALCIVVSFQSSLAQHASTSGSTVIVPHLIRFAGVLKDSSGHPLTGVAGITFSLYRDQEGGEALWLETQNAVLNRNGRYDVLLGAEHSEGVPMDLFTSGEARWLGIQVQGQGAEQPRVLLVSVPYALKAADAETVGGLPPSAFVLAAPTIRSTANPTQTADTVPPLVAGTTPVTTAGGTVNKLAKFDAKADVTNSQIFDNGTNVGIGNSAPGARLDVSGTGIFRGALSLPASGTAAATAGKNSQPFNLTASVFNSGTMAAVNQTFRWQAEPVGNNTASPSATLHLLFGSGNSTLAETGLSIATNGMIKFAAGQAFPGSGTITGVAAGSGLLGGGTSGSLTLKLNTVFTDTLYPRLAASFNNYVGDQNIGGGLSVNRSSFLEGGAFIAGDGRNTVIGDPGCGFGLAGLGFVFNGGLSGCTNYSLLGDGTNTYLNRPAGGFLTFREGNADQMIVSSGGNVSIGTLNSGGRLTVSASTSTAAALDIASGAIRIEGADVSTKTAAFVHTAHTGLPPQGNICFIPGTITSTEGTFLDHPALNGNSRALVFVTPRGDGTAASNLPSEAYFAEYFVTSPCSLPSNRWVITNAFGITGGQQFNVLVIEP